MAQHDGVAMSLRRQKPIRGVAFLVLGLFAFSLHDVALKLVSGNYPLGQVMFTRSFVALPIILALVHFGVGLRALADRRIGFLMTRAAMLLVGYFCYYLAFAAIPFADAVALYCTVPLFIVVMAGPLLGERVGLTRWIAVLVGFAGVVVMLRPGAGIFEPAGLLILLCAFLYSLAMVMTRGIGPGMSGAVMSFYNNAIYLAFAPLLGLMVSVPGLAADTHPSVAFLLRPWAWPPAMDLALMMSCGVTGALGIIGLTAAYREADANLVGSFEYSFLIWAALWGFLIFSEVPTAGTLVGAGLVVAAGLAALWPRQTQPVQREPEPEPEPGRPA
jgi:drug/metabolite transporter (DMT)-like permease